LSSQREILLIEDNPGDVRLMREALRNADSQATLQVVNDGDEALRYLRQEGEYLDARRPSLIFMDLNLPKSDARELLERLSGRDRQAAELPNHQVHHIVGVTLSANAI